MAFPQLANFVKDAARELGFDLAGVAAAGPFRELGRLPGWLAEGRGGDMRYLEARNEAGELKRAALQNVAPWARSVIVCAINYNSAEPYSIQADDTSRGWISRYAWGQRDYHHVVFDKLRALEARLHTKAEEAGAGTVRSWCYVDTGPLVERVYAKYAGIGWLGKNACVINQQLGSWLFLGVILCSIELTPDAPAPDRCGTCTACLDACPTNAFTGPHELDATRCISYLTIEKKGALPEDLREGMGRHIFGCDICQDVCPWNRKAPVTAEPNFAPRPQLVNPALDWLASLDVEAFRAAFRGSPVKRAKLSGVRRNVVTAMGNSGRLEFIPTLKEMLNDEDPAVAEHARWALAKLQSRSARPDEQRADSENPQSPEALAR